MERHLLIGGGWIALGVTGAFWLTANLLGIDALYPASWWIVQWSAVVALAVAALCGIGVMRKRSWGMILLRFLSPIVVLYLAAYTVFGGERPWLLSALAIAVLVFAGYSMAVAFGKQGHAT